MFSKIAIIACVLAVANAGFLEGVESYRSYENAGYASYSTPAIAATSDNVYRSADNLHSVSAYSKSIATPFSSSNKHDIRITNPGVYAHAAPVVSTYAAAAPFAHTYAAAAPFATYAKAAPIAHTYAAAAPIATYAKAAPVISTYAAAAPIASHTTYTAGPLAAAPIAHATYAAPAASAYTAGIGYSAGLGYAAGHGYGAARSAHPSSLLGVAYSPAVAVSHMTYSSPIGINYAW